MSSQPEEEEDVLKGLCDDHVFESMDGKKYSKKDFIRIVSKEALGYDRLESSSQDWSQGKGL